MSNGPDFSRRKFLKTSSILASVAALCGAGIPAIAEAQTSNAHAAMGGEKTYRGMMFFTNALYFDTLAEATERIFPKDSLGPGAKDLAVPYFIDNQLAGAWGYNEREYTKGPYFPGTPSQGYQTAMLRKDIFQSAMEALNKEAMDRYDSDFPSLTNAQKDLLLTACQKGLLTIGDVSSSYFFSLLLGVTMAGVYADPIYNGNNNMDGWRMKEYPGAQMDYLEAIASDTFIKIDPMSLSDMM